MLFTGTLLPFVILTTNHNQVLLFYPVFTAIVRGGYNLIEIWLCQCIIWDNRVERAHKSKNADKTHSDKLYEQTVRTYEKENSQCVDPRRGTEASCSVQDSRHLMLRVLKSALGAEHSHAASAVPAMAGCAQSNWARLDLFLSIWLTSLFGPQPPKSW